LLEVHDDEENLLEKLGIKTREDKPYEKMTD